MNVRTAPVENEGTYMEKESGLMHDQRPMEKAAQHFLPGHEETVGLDAQVHEKS